MPDFLVEIPADTSIEALFKLQDASFPEDLKCSHSASYWRKGSHYCTFNITCEPEMLTILKLKYNITEKYRGMRS